MRFRKLLVAGRGEIAARVFRTCRGLGIATVAVEAPDDRGAYHCRAADDVQAVASYLDPAEIVRAAQAAGADVVHPGYGFLAERPDLAAAAGAEGLVWVGPPPRVLARAGDKLEARLAAASAGVPVLATGDPLEVGFPLLVKAAAGGGGRGMRLVRGADELESALAAAAREAEAAFGDGRVYLERLLARPRHVEVQVLADAHGGGVSLGERDCSVQRRHQKVLEEAPSPAVDAPLRERLAEAALAVARALEYVGAGTVEFLLDSGGGFWFLELNARIQVEHPVTEAVTGLDLVEQQLRIAAGEHVPRVPEPSGHAVEARLYAEHPLTFLPQAGTVTRLELPDGVRVDAGIEAGDTVPLAYDPLLAKLVAHGETRDEAFEALAAALRETHVGGVTTNVAFLRWLAAHPVLRAGDATTALLDESPPLSRPLRVPHPWLVGGDASSHAAPPTVEAAGHVHVAAGAAGELRAPMPGVVLRVLAREGEQVSEREPLVVIEAMKMETPLVSPGDAVVRRVHVAEGDQVAAGALLVELG